MVREHVGPIANLRDAVRARRSLWLFCRWCGHAERRDPRDLAFNVAANLTFDDLAARLRCRRCNARGRAAVLVSEHRFPDRND
jgi:hypothetical protein